MSTPRHASHRTGVLAYHHADHPGTLHGKQQQEQSLYKTPCNLVRLAALVGAPEELNPALATLNDAFAIVRYPDSTGRAPVDAVTGMRLQGTLTWRTRCWNG